jgi:hypothetical protein
MDIVRTYLKAGFGSVALLNGRWIAGHGVVFVLLTMLLGASPAFATTNWCAGTDTAAGCSTVDRQFSPLATSSVLLSIVNPSFEDDVQAGPGGFTVDVANGWTITPAAGRTATFWPVIPTQVNSVPQGNQVLALGNGTGPVDVSQTLGATLAANTTYTLTYFVGQRKDFAFGSYTVTLFAAAAGLAFDNGTLAPTAGNFLQGTLVFNSGPAPAQFGQNLRIDFSTTGVAGQVLLDNIQLDASPTVPEPPRSA